MSMKCLPDMYAVTVFWCTINCFLVFIAMKLESNGNVHNLDMWQRPQSITWRDIKKSLDRQESSGNAFIQYEPLWCHDLCYLCMSDTYLADMTWIKCYHMRGLCLPWCSKHRDRPLIHILRPLLSFFLPFFPGINKHGRPGARIKGEECDVLQ